MSKVAESFWEKFGSEVNAKKWFSVETWQQIKLLFSPCCGLGRKVVRFRSADGKQTKVSFPTTYEGNTINTAKELEDAVIAELGASEPGYVAILLNPYKLLVLSNRTLKENDGLPPIDDYITLG